jgi:EmrB/QacA subfamily drug resistance transporter
VLAIFKEGPERNKALGVWSMVAAGGGAVGMLLGGALTQYVDWRWIFFINVPIAISVVFAAMKYVPASLPAKKESVDILGAVTVTGSLVSLVFGLAKAAANGWGASITLTSFAISVGLMTWFIINEMRVKHPLIRLGIFRKRNVTGGSIVMMLMPAAMFGMFFYLSIFLQQILHYSPMHTGFANLPFTLTIMAVAGVLSKKIASINPKLPLVVGPLLVALGLLYFARLPVDANYWTDILPGTITMAAGMAAVFVTATVATTNGISHKESGLVSGLLNTGQQIGGAIGLAVLTVISTAATRDKMTADAPLATMNAINNALVYGFHKGFIAAAVFAVAASFVALIVFKTHKPSASEQADDMENEAESLAAIPGV